MTLEPDDNILSGRRVLLVEDESLVTMFLQDTLGDIGCTVEALASRFQDAMEKARALSVDVAILDVNLNGHQTFPIAEALIDRGIPLVFATGYGASSVPASLRWIPVLHKPFRQPDLEQALRAALATKA